MAISLRDLLNRKLRAGHRVALSGIVAVLGCGYLASKNIITTPWLLLPFAITLGAGFYCAWFGRCPSAGGETLPPKMRVCPFCALEIDAELPVAEKPPVDQLANAIAVSRRETSTEIRKAESAGGVDQVER